MRTGKSITSFLMLVILLSTFSSLAGEWTASADTYVPNPDEGWKSGQYSYVSDGVRTVYGSWFTFRAKNIAQASSNVCTAAGENGNNHNEPRTAEATSWKKRYSRCGGNDDTIFRCTIRAHLLTQASGNADNGSWLGPKGLSYMKMEQQFTLHLFPAGENSIDEAETLEVSKEEEEDLTITYSTTGVEVTHAVSNDEFTIPERTMTLNKVRHVHSGEETVVYAEIVHNATCRASVSNNAETASAKSASYTTVFTFAEYTP